MFFLSAVGCISRKPPLDIFPLGFLVIFLHYFPRLTSTCIDIKDNDITTFSPLPFRWGVFFPSWEFRGFFFLMCP